LGKTTPSCKSTRRTYLPAILSDVHAEAGAEAGAALLRGLEDRMAMGRLNKGQALHDLVGQSPEMRRLFRMIPKVASGQHAVLLLGESGTGKATIARAIHSQSPLAERPFVVVDCQSAPPAVVESLLFAQATSRPEEELPGLGGALFFSEVWAMPPALQARFVRALQERDVRRAVGRREYPIDPHIIAASSRDLELAVRQGTFRHDLYSRLNTVSLRLPALRDRRQDVRLFVDHFLEAFGAQRGRRYFISPEAMKTLLEYDWPGNLRELKDCLGYASAACSDSVLKPEDLPVKTAGGGSASPVDGFPLEAGRILPLAEVEKQTILHALEQLNGDKLMTARVLGIGKTTLYRKLKEYGISNPLVERPETTR
jgi:DNA-binding NtrC family response regulator